MKLNSNFHPWRALLTLVVAGLCAQTTGCATMVTVDGKPMTETLWTKERSEVLQRASFDLGCERKKIDVKLLKASCRGFFENSCSPEQIGATGCDQRAVYVKLGQQGWVLNASSAR